MSESPPARRSPPAPPLSSSIPPPLSIDRGESPLSGESVAHLSASKVSSIVDLEPQSISSPMSNVTHSSINHSASNQLNPLINITGESGQRILLVSAEPWARNVLSLVSRCSQRRLEISHAINGAQGLYYMSQSIHLGSPYQLLVLTTPLAQLSAAMCVESLRAIERGLNRPPYPCLICSPEETPSTLIARHPQTLHLRVPDSPQAASIVAAGILQMIHTLQAYQTSAASSRKLADQLTLSTLDIELGGPS